MKAIAKSNGARMQREARSNAAIGAQSRRKHQWSDPFQDQIENTRWDALDEDVDLDALDLAGVDDEDAGDGDWLADHDLALEIAQRALH